MGAHRPKVVVHHDSTAANPACYRLELFDDPRELRLFKAAHVLEQRVVRDATPAVEVAGSKGPVQLGKKFRLLGREDRGDSPGIG